MFKIEKRFFEIFGHISQVTGFAPGRVNLIGEHTDYTGGMVFPVALNRGTYALAKRRKDFKWQFYSMNFHETGIISIEKDFTYKEEHSWANYPKSILSIMQDKGYLFEHGLDILYYGNIPNGAGLSSSASIEMVTCTLLNEVYGFDLSQSDCIGISKLAENNYMGVPCGIMDQFIIGKGKKNYGLLLNTHDLSFEHIPLNFMNHEFLIIDSKVERKLSDSRYKKVTQEISDGINKLKQKNMLPINQLKVEDLSGLKPHLSENEYLKIKHIVTENHRTLKGAWALRNFDVEAFGKYMVESHLSLKNNLCVSLEPLDNLVKEAMNLGALGARMTGAGFGGCLVVLIPREIKSSFVEQIKKSYNQSYNLKADVYDVISDHGARMLPNEGRVYDGIEGLIWYGHENKLIKKEDIHYKRNQILELLNLDAFQDRKDLSFCKDDMDLILEILINHKIDRKEIDKTRHSKMSFKTALLGLITPLPSEVIRNFYSKYESSKEEASTYLYDLSQTVGYIQEDKNMKWVHDTPYGALKMTINMSKPEKDPRAIADALKAKSIKYPKCLLCISNEGYRGRPDHPARQNLRLIPMTVNQQPWYFQYSPYAYYEEHGILIHEQHKPMEITQDTFSDMLDFVIQIPHYFIGSNGDLPIVGGSILSHAHYQFGRKVMPIMDAKEESIWFHDSHDLVEASIVKWPLSVIRLKSKDEEKLLKACQEILNLWRVYEDTSAHILPFTNEENHNTLTPVCYCKNDHYTFDLILRNNRTSEEYPHGIFHCHEEIHGIKKENIGLIEAMGLAILPPRLYKEIHIIDRYMNKEKLPKLDLELIEKHKTIIEHSNINSIKGIQEKIGDLFLKGLDHCGVFKDTPEGRQHFKRFLKALSWQERM